LLGDFDVIPRGGQVTVDEVQDALRKLNTCDVVSGCFDRLGDSLDPLNVFAQAAERTLCLGVGGRKVNPGVDVGVKVLQS
jgi:hypothetical protein